MGPAHSRAEGPREARCVMTSPSARLMLSFILIPHSIKVGPCTGTVVKKKFAVCRGQRRLTTERRLASVILRRRIKPRSTGFLAPALHRMNGALTHRAIRLWRDL